LKLSEAQHSPGSDTQSFSRKLSGGAVSYVSRLTKLGRDTVPFSLLIALIPATAGIVWLLVFYPGLMSADSIDQWKQTQTGVFSDHHPIFYALLLGLFRTLFRTPASVALFQILVLASLAGLLAAVTCLAGFPRWAIGTGAVLAALSPLNGTFIITLWKDIPFGLVAFALCILIFSVVVLGGDLTDRKGFWISLTLLSTLALLLRHNGLPVVLGAAAAIALLKGTKVRKRILASLTLAILAATSIHWTLVRALNVPPADFGVALVGLLAAHVAARTPMTAEERQVLEEISPLVDGWHYDCRTVDPTLYTGKFSDSALIRHQNELPGFVLKFSWRAPRTTASHLICASRFLWSPTGAKWFHGPNLYFDKTGEINSIFPTSMSPKQEYVWPRVAKRLLHWIQPTQEPPLAWLFWSPATALFAMLLACAVACLRMASLRPASVLLPLLCHTLALMLLIPSPDTRYQYPVNLAAIFFIPIWLASPSVMIERATRRLGRCVLAPRLGENP
jgi:hypothetical protein